MKVNEALIKIKSELVGILETYGKYLDIFSLEELQYMTLTIDSILMDKNYHSKICNLDILLADIFNFIDHFAMAGSKLEFIRDYKNRIEEIALVVLDEVIICKENDRKVS